jgi:calmodulin
MAQQIFRNYSNDELRAAFRQFDQDESGYIQANELENIMLRMGRRLNKSEITAMIQSLDASGDGKISFEEFSKWF